MRVQTEHDEKKCYEIFPFDWDARDLGLWYMDCMELVKGPGVLHLGNHENPGKSTYLTAGFHYVRGPESQMSKEC